MKPFTGSSSSTESFTGTYYDEQLERQEQQELASELDKEVAAAVEDYVVTAAAMDEHRKERERLNQAHNTAYRRLADLLKRLPGQCAIVGDNIVTLNHDDMYVRALSEVTYGTKRTVEQPAGDAGSDAE